MNAKNTNTYHLGEDYPSVYFTQREVDCLIQLLQGYTIVGAAEILALSPRTVEFYVKNMRMKIGVRSKSELIKAMRKIDFIETLNFKSISDDLLLTSESETT